MLPTTKISLDAKNAIRLSEIRRSDLPDFVQHLNDRDIYLATSRIPHPYRRSDGKDFLRSVRQATKKFGHPVHFAIRSESKQLIGVFGFDNLVYDHSVEIGYWLAKPHWSQGIMTDVVGAMCQYAIDAWNLVRIGARVRAGNVASARVLAKNRFQLEGLLRKAERKEDKFFNLQTFARIVE
ncbi:MAG: GNAT family N-acetyltransferase [Pirellulaceae bacterium]|nr:GNAT family N-acetyltransferase [Pirellulaceae bacterium]